jgi:hypothetical protein
MFACFLSASRERVVRCQVKVPDRATHRPTEEVRLLSGRTLEVALQRCRRAPGRKANLYAQTYAHERDEKTLVQATVVHFGALNAAVTSRAVATLPGFERALHAIDGLPTPA